MRYCGLSSGTIALSALPQQADVIADRLVGLLSEMHLWAAAGFVDTGLSFLSLLELYGTDVPERRMPALRVVEALDVVEHV